MRAAPLLGGLYFPEGPRWHDGQLWFSDMHSLQVIRCNLEGHRETVAEVPNRPSGLGWLPDGRLLVVSMLDRCLLRLDPDGFQVAADLSKMTDHPINDMVVDAEGRAYIGGFGFDLLGGGAPETSALYMVTPAGDISIVADDLSFPNGAVITEDARTLIVAETFGSRLTAFDIASDGSLSNRRVWADLAEGTYPDGCCLDADGAIWVATPRAKEVIRVHEGGEVTHRVAVETDAFACALGGPDRRTLLICTSVSSSPEETYPLLGRIDQLQVEAPGAGLP